MNNHHPKPSNSHLNEQEDPNLTPIHLLKLAENQLHTHNFSLCHQYALKSQQQLQHFSNDPNYDFNKIHASQLLTMSNILLNPRNYYSILQVPNFCNDLTLINSQFDSILSIIDPIKDHYFLGHEALNLVCKAYGCLSDPTKKTQFDSQFFGQRSENGEGFGDVGSAKFWTFCPYCFYMYEFFRVYEGYCLRCQNEGCRRAFHGVDVNCGAQLDEKGGNFGCYGYFPLGFNNEIGKKFESWSPIVGFTPVKGIEKNVDGRFNLNDNGGVGTNNVFNYDNDDDSIENLDESDDEDYNGGVNDWTKKQKSMSCSARKSRSRGRKSNEGVGVGVNGGEGFGEEYGGEGEAFVGVGNGFEGNDVEIFEEDGEIFVGIGSDGGI